MATLLHDLRLARRVLSKSPLFTAAVVVTLALGIGLNTAVFSVINGLLLRPLPGVRSPDELVQLFRTYRGSFLFGSSSVPHYRSVRDGTADIFSGVAAWSFQFMNSSVEGRPQQIVGAMTSANYFRVLGVNAALGRTFTPEEEAGLGAHRVAVLSYNGWQTMFGGDPQVVGRSLVLNGRSYTVVGVAPAEFRGSMPVLTPTLWVPLTQITDVLQEGAALWEARGDNFMTLVARLRPGVSVAQARQRLDIFVEGLAQEYPDHYDDSGFNLVPESEAGLHPSFGSAQFGFPLVVMAVVAVLLLLACVNVANLFLSRASARAREMAVRLSLGAGRLSLLRQLLTESLLFAGVAGLFGLGIAWWALRLLARVKLPMDGDFTPGMGIDGRVLLFTLGATLLTAVLFGLVPALQATRPALIPALKGEAPAGGSRSRLSRALVTAQAALSILLLVCAGLFVRNLQTAVTVDKGFASDHLLVAQVNPGLQGYSRARVEQFYEHLLTELRRHPGVSAAALAEHPPLSTGNSNRGVTVPGYTPAENENMLIDFVRSSPGYLATMGIRLLAGRDFTARDDSVAPRVLVVNEAFVKRFWPGQDALGKRVRFEDRDHTVVGVVPTGKYTRLGEPPTPYMYLPQAQYWVTGMTLFIRTRGDPAALMPVLRREVAALDPDLPLGNVGTMEQALRFSLLPATLAGSVLGLFGLLGLLLAAVGIYSVTAYSVSQRTREIGIRMATGASRSAVLRLVLRQGMSTILLGAVIGLAGAVLAALAMRGVLYGESPFDPMTFVGVPLLLLTVALLAILLPARRAAALDPLVALRQE